MSRFSTVWVFSETAARLPELIGGALKLGEKVNALVLGSREDAALAGALGAHIVYYLGERVNIIEEYSEVIATIVTAGSMPALVLTPATRGGRAMAALLGVRLHAGVVSEVTHVTAEPGNVTAKHMAYGGLAVSEETITSPVAVLVIQGGVFEAAAADASRVAECVDVAAPAATVKCVERRARGGSNVNLNQARRIVSVGRGFGSQDDLKLAEQLCVAIDAEIGCSRPIAEQEKWMERERYIGISGVMPKPDVYIAVGISGQIQHMVGVNSSMTIVAVNKDKNAPIFSFADYGIVGDLYKVLPALIGNLK